MSNELLTMFSGRADHLIHEGGEGIAHLFCLQPPQGFFSLGCQMRSPILRDRFFEKPRSPLSSLLFPRVRFFALPLFELLLDVGGLGVPLLKDRSCHTVPEAAGFVGELLVFRRDDLGDGP